LSIDAEHGTASEHKSRAILSLFKGAHERIDWPLRGSFGVLCARGQQVVTQSWLSRLSKKAGGSQSAPRGGVESSQTDLDRLWLCSWSGCFLGWRSIGVKLLM